MIKCLSINPFVRVKEKKNSLDSLQMSQIIRPIGNILNQSMSSQIINTLHFIEFIFYCGIE